MATERKNTFLLKRSNVPGKIPSPGDLKLGELALNTADVKLYTSGTTENTIVQIGWDRISRTGDTVTGDYIFNGDVSISGVSTFSDVTITGLTEDNTLDDILVVDTDGVVHTRDVSSLIPSDNVTGTGVNGQVSFWNGTNTQSGDNNLFWDNTNKRLGIGTDTPSETLHVNGNIFLQSTANRFKLSTFSEIYPYSNIPSRGTIYQSPGTSGGWRGTHRFRVGFNGSNVREGLFIGANADTSTSNIGINSIEPTAQLFIQADSALTTRNLLQIRDVTDSFDILRVNGRGDIITGRGVDTNVFIGENVAAGTFSGSNVIGIGRSVLQNAQGTLNIAIGTGVMSNIDGGFNIGIGYRPMLNTTEGTFNVVLGFEALENGGNNSFNTMVGFRAGRNIGDGERNVYLGANAGRDIIGGNQNVVIGDNANLSGVFASGTQDSVVIGSLARVEDVDQTNQIVIGYSAIGNGSNTVTIGNASITDLFLEGNGAGINLKSPNGTNYRLTVDNNGNLVGTSKTSLVLSTDADQTIDCALYDSVIWQTTFTANRLLTLDNWTEGCKLDIYFYNFSSNPYIIEVVNREDTTSSPQDVSIIDGSGDIIGNEFILEGGFNKAKSLRFTAIDAPTSIEAIGTLFQNPITPSNPVTGTGVNGQVSFWNGTNTQTGDNNLFWDNTNKRLGIGTDTPSETLHVNGNILLQSTANRFKLGTFSEIFPYSSSPFRGIMYYSPGTTGDWRGVHRFRVGFNGSNVREGLFIGANADTSTSNIGINSIEPTAQLFIQADSALTTRNLLQIRDVTDSFDILRVNGIGDIIVRGEVEINTINTDNTLNEILVTDSDGVIHKRDVSSLPTGGDSLFETGTTINSTQRKDVGNIADGSFNTSLGGQNNIVSGGTHSVIAGGYCNIAIGNCSTISGGRFNAASGNNSIIGGGGNNSSCASFTTVGGGYYNVASGRYATVAGGDTNIALCNGSTIGGGIFNAACGVSSTVSGGFCNIAIGDCSTVSGGNNNCAEGVCSTISGGRNNVTSGCLSTISGGGSASPYYQNIASGNGSVIGGGGGYFGHTASGNYSTIGGGCFNISNGNFSTIGGGGNNNTSSCFSTISGGRNNTSSNYYSFVGGGRGNVSGCEYSTVGGGYYNSNNGPFSTIAGGNYNSINGNSSTISGGVNNTVNSHCSIIGGGNENCLSFSAPCSVIVGGENNQMCGCGPFDTQNWSTIVGGRCNTVTGNLAGILGGECNNANRNCSMIIGSNITSIAACTTHVNNLAIMDSPTNDNTIDSILVRDTNGIVKTRAASSLGGGGSAKSSLFIQTDGNQEIDCSLYDTVVWDVEIDDDRTIILNNWVDGCSLDLYINNQSFADRTISLSTREDTSGTTVPTSIVRNGNITSGTFVAPKNVLVGNYLRINAIVTGSFIGSVATFLQPDIVVESSGTEISFTEKTIYGSSDTPITGNLTDNLAGARLGVTQKIYHNSSTEPTVPAGWVLIGNTSYVEDELNIIYVEWAKGSRVEYWIAQEF